jgi:hypothetical protein
MKSPVTPVSVGTRGGWRVRLIRALCALVPVFAFAAAARADEAADGAASGTPASAPALPTLARFLPSNTGFFVEANDAEDVLIALAEPELWVALAEFVGQPAEVDDTTVWEKRVTESLGVSPRAAIRQLLSKSVAFAGEGFGLTQDAVIVCRPAEPLDPLLQQWGATPEPTDAAVLLYRLRSGLGLATRDGIACFGDPNPRQGLFADVIRVIGDSTASRLADSDAFRRLYAQVARRGDAPTALLYVRMDGAVWPAIAAAAASAPSDAPPEFPLPEFLRGAEHVMLAMQREGLELRFTAAKLPPTPLSQRHAPLSPLAALPAGAIFEWQGAIDVPRWLDAAAGLNERNVMNVALRMLERTAGLRELADSLGSNAGVYVGTVNPKRNWADAPPVPAIGAIILLDDEVAAERRLQTLSDAVSVYNLLAINNGWKALEPPQSTIINGMGVQVLPLHPLFGDDPKALWCGDLTLCWTISRKALFIATHPDWLDALIRARLAATSPEREAAGGSAAATRGLRRDQAGLWISAAEAGRLAQQWLAFAATHAPETTTEEWWKQWQPAAQNARLGVTVTQKSEDRRLRVDSVDAGSPARGLLRPGDEIVGANGRRFATTQPAVEFRQEIEQRPHAGWLEIILDRDGGLVARRVRLPFVYPPEILRRVSALGGLVREMTYVEPGAEAEAPLGRLTVELVPPADRPVFLGGLKNGSSK